MTDEITEIPLDVEESSTVIVDKETNGVAFHHSGSMRIGVIGAGPAGLAAAKNLLEEPNLEYFQLIVFEQCDDLGGTWLYTDQVGKDKNGLHVHSALYKDLWTNLPKEVMAYPDFSYPDTGRSYNPSSVVLQYLNDYADHYEIKPHIKFNYHVTNISPVGDGWSLTALDLKTNLEHVYYFDAVMICSGPLITPVYPIIDGIARFSGSQIHSKEYKTTQPYKDKTVLIVGLGASGMDIAYQLSKVTNKVIISQSNSFFMKSKFPDNVVIKPKVTSLNEKTVTFTDDSTEIVDCIIYCTGYTHNYPFLSADCGITVDQYVFPLYKHLINIERPSMSFIGIPELASNFYMVDYQAKTVIKLLKKQVALPEQSEMLADLDQDIDERKKEGQPKKYYHRLFYERTVKYFADLAKLGQLEPVPPVQIKLYSDAFMRTINNFESFRKDNYKIIDDETYEIDVSI